MNRDMQDYSPPPAEYSGLPPEITPPGPEDTPEGLPQPEAAPAKRRRRLRFLLYAAAALVYLGLLFKPGGTPRPAPSAEPIPPVATAAPEPSAEPTPESSPEPTGPLTNVPKIRVEFFSFSHAHYGRVYMDNTKALHSVEVLVRDKTLDLVAYDYYLTEEEIAFGWFELPMVSTGDLYMEHMSEYEAAGVPIPGTDFISPAWPEFEMTVKAWYEADDGSGEAMLTQTLEPGFEMGIGVSYWPYDWDEQRPQNCFLVIPWAETDQISYVINDPDAVTNPTIFSVDISYNGRHAAPEEYETLLYREEYDLFDHDTGEYIPTVGYTKQLMLRRPDWMPEQGTVHIVIVQKLATTGETWTNEYDLPYPG